MKVSISIGEDWVNGSDNVVRDMEGYVRLSETMRRIGLISVPMEKRIDATAFAWLNMMGHGNER